MRGAGSGGEGGRVPRRPPVLPDRLARVPFSLSEAAEHGLSRTELRRFDLRAPTRGVRSTTTAPRPDDVVAQCLDLAPALPDDAVFCHATALALHGADLPFGVASPRGLHVQVGPRGSWPRRRGIVAHQRSGADVPHVVLPNGLRVMTPERAWVQLASAVSPRELVVAADALTRRRSPVSSPAALQDAVARLAPGTRGIRLLRTALDRARPGTDSCMETRLRWELVDAGLPCPLVNDLVRAPDGYVVAMPDLSYREQLVAVEYDGDVHRTDRDTWRRDISRRQELESLGWRVITCTADDVLRYPSRAVAWVRRALHGR